MDAQTGAVGDGDPIDVIELGDTPLPMGSVVPVRVLGSLALIDEGETDHKILVIRDSDDRYASVGSLQDLDRLKPHTLSRLIDWLKNYKTSDGKPANKFKSEVPTTAVEAIQIVQEVNQFYNNLKAGQVADAPDDYVLV